MQDALSEMNTLEGVLCAGLWIDANEIVSGKFLCLLFWDDERFLRDSRELTNCFPEILRHEVEKKSEISHHYDYFYDPNRQI